MNEESVDVLSKSRRRREVARVGLRKSIRNKSNTLTVTHLGGTTGGEGGEGTDFEDPSHEDRVCSSV